MGDDSMHGEIARFGQYAAFLDVGRAGVRPELERREPPRDQVGIGGRADADHDVDLLGQEVEIGLLGISACAVPRAALEIPPRSAVRAKARRSVKSSTAVTLHDWNALSELMEGDLADPASIDQATHGVDVIVSAVQGGPDTIIDGQVALAQAGKRNGVRRTLPSDFGLGLFKATRGEHAAFDWRRTADEGIAAIGLEQVNILQGALMELFMPGMGATDLDKGTVGLFGDGTLPIDVTSVEDTARMTARVALDRTVPAGNFDLRRAFMARADQAPIRVTSIVYGAFLDMLGAEMPIIQPRLHCGYTGITRTTCSTSRPRTT